MDPGSPELAPAVPARLTAAVAVTLAAALACAAPAETSSVLARLGDAGLEAVAPAPPVEPHRLGSATRRALRLAPGQAVELRIDPVGRALHFSVGLESSPEPTGPVGCTIDLQIGDSWQTIFEETLPGGSAGWQDRRLALPASPRDPSPGPGADTADPDGRRRLRLRVEPSAEDSAAPAGVLWGGLLLIGRDSSPQPGPNIVVLSLDTLGADYLGTFGGEPDASPRLDGFLDQAFSFRRAYAQYGSTLPSHSSLFSGQYPLRHRRYYGPRPALDSLVEDLAHRGYTTVAFTENAYVGSAFGFDRGFDHFDEGGAEGLAAFRRNGAPSFEQALRWLETRDPALPFFLFLHTYEVHSPYLPPEGAPRALADRLSPGDQRLFGPKRIPVSLMKHNQGEASLDPATLARYRALHVGEIRALDSLVGNLLGQLDILGLGADSLVVLTSDHGDQFGEHGKVGHGESLHDRVLHVPLAFRWPGNIAPGVSSDPVQLVDVLPTVLDLAGIPQPTGRDGRSLVAYFDGGAGGPPTPAYSEQQTASQECDAWSEPGPCRLDRVAIHTGRFKYVSSAKPPFERLYDLDSEEGEARDVAALHPEQLRRHRALLEAYRSRAGERAAAEELSPGDVDPATLERLRELGYLE